jgi:hypothetical protein
MRLREQAGPRPSVLPVLLPLPILSGLIWAVLARLAIQGRDGTGDHWAHGAAFGVLLVALLASAPRPKDGEETTRRCNP